MGLFYWPPNTGNFEPIVTGQPPGAVVSPRSLPIQNDGTFVDEQGFTLLVTTNYIGVRIFSD